MAASTTTEPTISSMRRDAPRTRTGSVDLAIDGPGPNLKVEEPSGGSETLPPARDAGQSAGGRAARSRRGGPRPGPGRDRARCRPGPRGRPGRPGRRRRAGPARRWRCDRPRRRRRRAAPPSGSRGRSGRADARRRRSARARRAPASPRRRRPGIADSSSKTTSGWRSASTRSRPVSVSAGWRSGCGSSARPSSCSVAACADDVAGGVVHADRARQLQRDGAGARRRGRRRRAGGDRGTP